MTPTQIYELILSRPDAELLASFATEQRLSCSKCSSISVRQLADSSITGIGTCPACKERVPLVMATYYPKQKSTSPEFAVRNHRHFWTQVYYQEVTEQKLRLNPFHPVPDPLSGQRTQEELEIFRASHILLMAGLTNALAALPEQATAERIELLQRISRCQGVLDADGWWRGTVEMDGGSLPMTRFEDPQQATYWAYVVLEKHGLLAKTSPNLASDSATA